MRKRCLHVGLIAVLASVIAITVLTIFFESHDTSNLPNDYAVVFDAGSSGTRMYVYKWKAGFSAAKGDPLVVDQHDSCKCDDKGIDKVRSKDEIIKSFQKCMKQAEDNIPEQRRDRTHIILAATAGMRLLNLKNSTASDLVLTYIKEYFQSSKFLFKNSSQVRIISGKEEGTNAWISANYFLNKFKPYADPLDTSGILDLGGASTQIVYVPKDANMNNKNFFSTLKIYGVVYKPYSHSFLCWGVNEINLLYKAYVLKKNNYGVNSKASCFPVDSTGFMVGSEIYSSPCANGLAFNNTFNFTANTSNIDASSTYKFDGLSDRENCEKEIDILLPKPKCNYEECSFDDVYQPPVLGRDFSAFSNFFYTLNNTESLLNKTIGSNLDEFKKATDFICAKTFTELKDLNVKNNANIKENFLAGMCFSNVYVLKLWGNYGFTDLKNMYISEKINQYSVGWTLGYLVNELNRDDFLPYEVPPRKLSPKYYIPTVTVLSLITIAILFVLIFTYFKSPHNDFEMLSLKKTENNKNQYDDNNA